MFVSLCQAICVKRLRDGDRSDDSDRGDNSDNSDRSDLCQAIETATDCVQQLRQREQ